MVPDFVNLGKNHRNRYHILYLESNLETLRHLTGRVMVVMVVVWVFMSIFRICA